MVDIEDYLARERKKYMVMGWFFLAIQIFIILGVYKIGNNSILYWFCNHTPIMFSLAFFFRKKEIIKSLINVGFIPQLIWTLDFTVRLTTGEVLLGITNYVFEKNGFWVMLPILVHLFSTNMAIIVMHNENPTLKSLYYSLFYLVVLFLISILFTNPEANINCIYEVCGFDITFKGYTYLWVFIAFSLIIIPTYFFQRLLYFYFNKPKKKPRK